MSKMADRQVALGGKTFTLRFSLATYEALEEHFGVDSMEAVNKRMMAPLRAKDTYAMLWAMMRTHHPEIGLAEIEALVRPMSYGDILEIAVAAFLAGMPAAKEGGGSAPADPPSTGPSPVS